MFLSHFQTGAAMQVTSKYTIKNVFFLLFKKGAGTPLRRVPSQKTLILNILAPILAQTYSYTLCVRMCKCIHQFLVTQWQLYFGLRPLLPIKFKYLKEICSSNVVGLGAPLSTFFCGAI